MSHPSRSPTLLPSLPPSLHLSTTCRLEATGTSITGEASKKPNGWREGGREERRKKKGE